jgi:amino acid transporter
LADILAIWYPEFSSSYIRILFFIVLYGLLTYINIRGVKQGSQFAGAMCLLKLTPLILLIVVGIFSIDAGNLTVKTMPAIKTIGATALTLFFAFGGIETALNVSGEIKNPRIAIPKGIFMGVFGVLVIYVLLQLVSQGVLGDQLAQHKKAPLAALAIQLIGPVGGTVILITGLVSMFGMIGGDVLATSRLLFAASTDKLLPDLLGRIHPKFATPYISIAVYSVVIVILASSGGFKQLATLASSSVLIIYLAVVLAMIKLRFNKDYSGGFKIPGGMPVPLMAVTVICWFLYQVSWPEVKAMGIFFIGCTVVYFINSYVRKQAK